MSALTSKRNVLLLGFVSSGVLMIAAGRPWVSGSLNDGVLAASSVQATGNQAVPGYFGIALAAAACLLAAALGGRIVRWPAAVLSVLASIATLALAIYVLFNPGEALKSRMTDVTGHNGEALARGEMTAWYWVAVFMSIVLLIASLAGLAGLRRWHGLSSRYDAPSEQRARGEESDWDLMTRGVDPTESDADGSVSPATSAPRKNNDPVK